MASTLFLLISISLLINPLLTQSNLHKTNKILKSTTFPQLSPTPSSNHQTPPTVFFQVTKPIKLPKTNPCSHRILRHDFGYTYGKSPVLANYTPPFHCKSNNFAKIVLEWKASCKGRQFDRIFGVWLGGVELLRSCTAEPRATGIVWKVEKDITRYYSLLVKSDTQILAVYLGNLVDETYTGVYHVDLTFHFYPAENELTHEDSNLGKSLSRYGSYADLILPISRNLPLNDGLWFEIENSTDTQSKEFEIPQNTYRAVLEVYLSFHENDEFWYGNLPNEYIEANNITGVPGNGPFREVVVSLDGQVAGAIWPFTVIYTGGINPLLWRPITGIGSYDLPTYDIEITPFLGSMLDGEPHKLGFSVTNGLNVWYIDANLHLWLDSKKSKVKGKVLTDRSDPLLLSSKLDIIAFDGTFSVNASRFISSTGWVESSHGKITTRFVQSLEYTNSMIISNDGNSQIVNQLIQFNDTVVEKASSSEVRSVKSFKTFPLYLYSDYLDHGNGTYLSVTNVTLGYNEKKSEGEGTGHGFAIYNLNNKQEGEGVIVVKDNLVRSGVGSTEQVYEYHGDDFCYFRNISSWNYSILYDRVEYTCDRNTDSGFEFRRGRWDFAA